MLLPLCLLYVGAHRGNRGEERERRQSVDHLCGPQQPQLSLPTSEAKRVTSTKSGEFLSHLDANGKCISAKLRASFCLLVPVIAVESGRVQFGSLNRGYTVFENNVTWEKRAPYFCNLYVILSRSGQLFSYSYS